MATLKDINAINTQKFVMVTYEFGFPLYISKLNNGGIDVSEDKNEAEIWGYADTLSVAKIQYHKAETGYTGLTWEAK